MPFYAQHIKAARLHLQKNDPVMKRVLKLVGPFVAKIQRDRFATLVNSILSQQISVAAATAIRQRLLEATEEAGINPESLLRFDLESLRRLGLSQQKATSVLSLAEHVRSGLVVLETIHQKNDQDVIAELTQVQGVGEWTAQVFLMFSLGRLDVLPVDDLGIKQAIQDRYDLEELPGSAEVESIAENWRPYATVASWYLWQSLELE
ncbi:MAG: DNA-3-methyladenine glycosylase II [Mariniblastus sp.]|jgi:DNA-3-methyladenine glycosylase II